MFYKIFFYLIYLTHATVHSFNSTTIDISTISSTRVIDYLQSSDTCGQMIARTNNLYHLSTTNIFQSSPRDALTTYSNIIQVAGPGVGRVGFGTTNTDKRVVVMLNSTNEHCAVY